jgi:hypothetical protein
MVMNSVNDPRETAKKPAELPSTVSRLPPITATTEERVIALLHEISSAVRDLDLRMGLLEGRIRASERMALGTDETQEEEDDPESLTTPSASHDVEQVERSDTDHAPPPVPGLALRSDGKVLLSVAYLTGAELDGRERWEGVILNVAEAWDAIDAVSDGCDDAASRVAGHILWRGKKKGEPEGSGGDDRE